MSQITRRTTDKSRAYQIFDNSPCLQSDDDLSDDDADMDGDAEAEGDAEEDADGNAAATFKESEHICPSNRETGHVAIR